MQGKFLLKDYNNLIKTIDYRPLTPEERAEFKTQCLALSVGLDHIADMAETINETEDRGSTKDTEYDVAQHQDSKPPLEQFEEHVPCKEVGKIVGVRSDH